MKTAKDYPITTKYGYDPSYPLNGGFHMGVDRAMPVGTPVLLNKKTKIGLSGNSGYSTGSHLHIGRFTNGVVKNPGKRGFYFPSFVGARPRVHSVGEDKTNGKYVRVQTWRGEIYVFLHLSKITCKPGDRIF